MKFPMAPTISTTTTRGGRLCTTGSPTAARGGATSWMAPRIALGLFPAVAKQLALQYVLTKVVGAGISHFGLHAEEDVRARYNNEVYAEGSTIRLSAVIVFVFNIAQNFASQMTMSPADTESRDLANSACTVNVVALFMFSLYSAAGGIGSDLVASQQAGGGISPRRYIMWILTTPSLIHAVGIRSRLSHVASEERRARPDSEGDNVVPDFGIPTESSSKSLSTMDTSGDSLRSTELSLQSPFQDERVANIASLTMFVTGFLGIARFVWDHCWAVVPMALLTASFACFGYISCFIWLALSQTKVRRGMGLEGTRDALRNLFLATFSVFPLAHLLAFTGVMDPVMEEKLYCCGDMMMKVLILGNVAVENVFETRESLLRGFKDEQKNKMLEQLQTAVESGDKFISMVSHELRTPIHGIMGLAEALLITPSNRGGGHWDSENSPLTERATETELHSIRAIQKSGRSLLDLVNNLLAHASLRAGGLSLVVEKRPFDIVEVVRHCVEMKHAYLAPGVTISAEVDDDVWSCCRSVPDAYDNSEDGDGCASTASCDPMDKDKSQGRTVMVMGDPMRIEQVILNLVNNAIRHTTMGFVKVRVRRSKLSELVPPGSSGISKDPDTGEALDVKLLPACYRQLSESSDVESDGEDDGEGDTAGAGRERVLCNKAVVIEVRDSGCGISEKDRGDIFGMFCRGNRGCERYEPGVGIGGGGVGLGLTLCQQLVSAHDSNLSVQSVVDFGSAFSFSLACDDTMHNSKKRTIRWSQAPSTNDLRYHVPGSQAKADKVIEETHQTIVEESLREERPEVYIEKTAGSIATDSSSESGKSSIIHLQRGAKSRPPPPAPLLVNQEAASADDCAPASGVVSPSSPSSVIESPILNRTPSGRDRVPTPLKVTRSRLSLGSSGSESPSTIRRRSFVDVLEDHKNSGNARPGRMSCPSGRIKATRVLVVDDNENNLLVMANMLCPNGFEVEMARSGEECLSLLSARIGTDNVPDVVLLDVMMGGISGVECCEQIRQYRGMAEHELPVILVTASESDSVMQNGFLAGATDFLQKPFALTVLLARLESALRLRELFTSTVSRERDRSLLRRMLPETIIDRLESGQNLIADHHNSVTVLFSDIIGFTELSQNCSTSALMLMLNELFSAFDEALDRHGVHKVETIGDAYMCVTGHDGIGNHAERMAAFAREMIDVCDRVKPPFQRTAQRSSDDVSSPRSPRGVTPPEAPSQKLKIRVGMHSGPVHAGVVGTRCPRYCFFGDTVNTASRMESTSFPMAVHVSSTTANLLQNGGGSVETILLGPRCIKGKGIMRTHVLRMGDYLGACKAFAELEAQHPTTELTRTQDESGGVQDESMMAGLYDTSTWVMGSFSGESNAKGGDVVGHRRGIAISDPHRTQLRPPPLELDCSRRDTSNCYCCIAKGMLFASDDAVVTRRSAAGSASFADMFASVSPASSLATASTPSFEEDLESTSALLYLAKYIGVAGEVLHALQHNRATLGTLERLTARDLCTMGVTTPMDAISLLRAATALGTLRQFKAVADTKHRDLHRELEQLKKKKNAKRFGR
mmetsp:Transcript_35367/g.88457  ORF Transcript_35367/g.88457 Transcript_35367/m.88457 type:complete len:1558 (-) Transcript_35367:178-4851(-)